jgi:hypothetical protein
LDCRTADEGCRHALFSLSSAREAATDRTNAAATSWHRRQPQSRRQTNRTSRWRHQHPFCNRPGKSPRNCTRRVCNKCLAIPVSFLRGHVWG